MDRTSPRGRSLELHAKAYFASQGIVLVDYLSVAIGVGSIKRHHKFDLGSQNPPVLVECKAHSWTEGGNVPSAKLSAWNEAMLAFLGAPTHFRKILFVARRVRGHQSLAQYYVARFSHYIPDDVEIWEYDETTRQARRLPLSENS